MDYDGFSLINHAFWDIPICGNPHMANNDDEHRLKDPSVFKPCHCMVYLKLDQAIPGFQNGRWSTTRHDPKSLRTPASKGLPSKQKYGCIRMINPSKFGDLGRILCFGSKIRSYILTKSQLTLRDVTHGLSFEVNIMKHPQVPATGWCLAVLQAGVSKPIWL